MDKNTSYYNFGLHNEPQSNQSSTMELVHTHTPWFLQ